MKQAFARLRAVTLGLLRTGTAPRAVAECLALALTIGICPIIGVATPLLAALALWRRLNLPLIQAVNYAITALQWLMIVPFLRLGEWLCRAEPLPLSPSEILARVRADTPAFFAEFAGAIWHAALGWLVCIGPLYLLLVAVLLPLTRRLVPAGRTGAPPV